MGPQAARFNSGALLQQDWSGSERAIRSQRVAKTGGWCAVTAGAGPS